MAQHSEDAQSDKRIAANTNDGKCFICSPLDFPTNEADFSKPLWGFQVCSKHDVHEIASFNGMLRQEARKALEKISREENKLSGAANESSTPVTKSSVQSDTASKQQAGAELPHRQADHLVDDPTPSGSATTSSRMDDAQRVLNVATMYAELNVAAISLSAALNTMKHIKKEDLPAKTLKSYVRKVRKVTKEMMDTAGGKADPKEEAKEEGDGAEEAGGEGDGD